MGGRISVLTIIGDINVDLNLAITEWPSLGGDTRAHTATWSNGGTGLNNCVAVANLGGQCRLWGRIGADAVGQGVLDWGRQHGIDISEVQHDAHTPTGLCTIPVVPGGERTFFSFRGANVNWQCPHPWPNTPGWLHVCGHALIEDPQRASSIQALQQAQQHGWQTSIDLCAPLAPHIGNILAVLPASLTCLLGNQDEMQTAIATTNPELWQHAATLLVTKQGAAGAHMRHQNGDAVQLPGFAVHAQDTTACGDAFAGVLVWSLYHGAAWHSAGVLANAVGALTASQRGGADSIPHTAAVTTLLRQHQLPLPTWVQMIEYPTHDEYVTQQQDERQQ
jgi:ribokinase